MPAPRFSPKTTAFLRALTRHNDRDWFRERRETYEEHVRAPMIATIERLADDLRAFAPDLVASPKVSMYRIYRDTRFAADKAPFKTHVSAVFPHRNLGKHEGAGLYFHVATDHVLVGGGIYAPAPPQLFRVRQHIAANRRRLESIVGATTFRRSYGSLTGQQLKRVPRGFDPDDPAADYLRLKQFLAGSEHPASFATGARFYPSLVRLFRHLAPLVHFLNEPLAGKRFALA